MKGNGVKQSLFSGPPPFIDKPADKYPVEVVQEGSNRTVLIVQAAAFTKLVTLLLPCPRLLVTFLLCSLFTGTWET